MTGANASLWVDGPFAPRSCRAFDALMGSVAWCNFAAIGLGRERVPCGTA